MPVRFARIRIAGFKSFADPASLEIMPGLTGVVGPNGCGKSNVVDALRWVMGEASAKSLRGGEMEDVIFAGTVGRASRNFGEVTISLEDTAGLAPPPFQGEPELEITRRIERGSGSAYRINGREARARDVATLFADFASGARASAMVSQGRVSALVNARPEERRVILEEAAGITGLHARRHEAELKLRAAETNLTRAEDLRGQVESRLGELRKQARQANRYRNLSGAIRAAETEHLATERAIAVAKRTALRAAFATATATVRTAKIAAAEAATAAEATEAALPALREADAAARTALERARIGAEQAIEAEARARAARNEAASRAATISRDHDHAARIVGDAEQATARLADERIRLEAEAEAAPALIEVAEQAAHGAALAMEAAESRATAAAETAARLAAETDAARRQSTEAEARAKRARARYSETDAEYRRAVSALIAPETLAAADASMRAVEAEQSAAIGEIEAARQAVTSTEAARAEAEKHLSAARNASIAADSQTAKFRAEADALASLLAQKFGREASPVLDEITVPPGLEAALGAALREELSAGIDPKAARFWRALPPLDADTAIPKLSTMINAPEALARALGHILLLPEGASGDTVQAALAPGQILVSRQGAVWRWDGFTIRAGAPNEAAVRLAQRNRLAILRTELAAAAETAETARGARGTAEAAERNARAAEAAARDARRGAEARADRSRTELTKRREAFARLEAEAARASTRAASLEDDRTRLKAELAEADAALAEARTALAALPDADAARRAVDAARASLAETRRQETAARNQIMQHRNAQDQRIKRLEILRREAEDWAERAQDAQSRLADLKARQDAARAVLEEFAGAPDPSHLKRAAFEARDAAEAAHKTAAEQLAIAIRTFETAQRDARACDAALAAARENVVRQEGLAAQADHEWGAIAETILQRLGADPALPEIAEAMPDAAERARKRFERLTRERDEMGPVNLRAETEVAEIEAQIAVIERERDDIAGAIAKLRGSIGHLNREGRERLTAVFTEVDRHFRALFTRMFGGGRAHLALVGSDDPLLAGLEIYTQPPGKKLATLSLLSGGEQALTALSLIFAVFRCNPAPISVLDEVDAPLDDANVERFCDLLEDVVRETGTRIMVVTHHHLTMARMHRLYGVTMQERGVSRLLSVDLGGAVALTENAGTALAAE